MSNKTFFVLIFIFMSGTLDAMSEEKDEYEEVQTYSIYQKNRPHLLSVSDEKWNEATDHERLIWLNKLREKSYAKRSLKQKCTDEDCLTIGLLSVGWGISLYLCFQAYNYYY